MTLYEQFGFSFPKTLYLRDLSAFVVETHIIEIRSPSTNSYTKIALFCSLFLDFHFRILYSIILILAILP